MEINYQKIGERIRYIRKQKKMKQEALAEAAGISITHMSHIETGATKASIVSVVSIADALQCTPNDLLCDSIAVAKPQFLAEIEDVLKDSTEYEIRVIADVIRATKSSLRNRKGLLLTRE